ncbi:MAG: sensor histidine kinase RegB [Planktomarina sp.]
MTNAAGYIDQSARSNWIKLRTLVAVRWFGVIGQTVALVMANQIYGIAVPIVPCVLAIGLSIWVNVVAFIAFPENRRLSEAETAFMLLFDILQLSFLLALTGGLNNPFALLMLAPVTIAATALPSRITLFLGGAAILLTTAFWAVHVPLQTVDGRILRLPSLFSFGSWVAIVTGITFIALYTRIITSEISSMAEALSATQMALAREQKLTDLGGVIAATAHELGTPLATIKLASAELMDDLPEGSDQKEDAKLIRDQAERCREIMHEMGRIGKDDRHMCAAPLVSIAQEAAEPHKHRGKEITFKSLNPSNPHPTVHRRPEIIHGLRNLIQNAVDFAYDRVEVHTDWDTRTATIIIMDDGPGFPQDIINRLGDPFLRQRRKSGRSKRPGYKGMGLGLFIAKTLLERTGADIAFTNTENGARIQVTWPLSALIADQSDIGADNFRNTF